MLRSALSILLLGSTSALLAQVPAQGPESWQLLNGAHTTVAVHPQDSRTFYVGAADGHVLRTRDAGLTWTSHGLKTEISSDPITGLVPMADDTLFATTLVRDAFWRSTDAGDSWTKLVLPQGVSITRPQVQRVAPGAVLLGSADGITYLTRDGGRLIDTLLRQGQIFSAGDGTLVEFDYASNRVTTYQSSDLGETWTRVEGGAFTGVVSNFFGLVAHPRDAQHYALSVNRESELLVTTDGGVTFTAADLPGGDILSVIWLSETELLSYDERQAAARSTDGGKTWVADPSATFANFLSSDHAAVARAEDGTQIVVTLGQVYRRDAGQTDFQRIRTEFDATQVQALIPASDDVAFLTYNNRQNTNLSIAWKTSNGGATWLPLDLRTDPVNTAVPDYALSVDTILGINGPKIMMSTDGAQTWVQKTTTSTGFNPILKIIPWGPNFLALTASVPLYSLDRGQSWAQLPNGASSGVSSGLIRAQTLDDGTILIAGDAGNGTVFRVSRDSGVTYLTSVIPGYAAANFTFTANGKLYMAPSLVSLDTGRTWTDLKTQPNFGRSRHGDVSFRTSQEGYFFQQSGNGFVTVTTDGGATWTETRADNLGIAAFLRTITWRGEQLAYGAGAGMYRYDATAWPTAPVIFAGAPSSIRERPVGTLRLSPNPVRAGSRVRLTTALVLGVQLELCTALGQRVSVLPIQSNELELPGDIPAGLYILRSTDGRFASKILVQ